MNDRSGEVTRILHAIDDGESEAVQRLWELVYGELRAIAGRQMAGERPGHTLGATALVHEAFLRLCPSEMGEFENSRHFFAAAAEAMRRIRVEYARRRGAKKRGGHKAASLETEPPVFDQNHDEVLAVNDALVKLEELSPRQAEVVKLRYFAGLSVDDAAKAVGVSPRTVDNDWRLARAWLFVELNDGEDVGADGSGGL